uniref:Tudor domain-containing protein n=1 Tax=Gongylonema pulchrum TaxID=637853 RepID=A0A183E2X7_9BILA
LAIYRRCLMEREKWITAHKQTTVHAIAVLRDSELVLPCFHLSPEEQTEVEEVWKPNETFIGKKTRQIIDKVKEVRVLLRTKARSMSLLLIISDGTKLFILSQVERHKKEQKNEWNYIWEKADFSTKFHGQWRSVVDIDPSLSVVQKTVTLIKRFMTREKNQAKLGDLFELILPKAGRREMGWYRCVRKSTNATRIANMYYVDVITNSTPEIAMEYDFGSLKLRSRALATPWSECNRCGTSKGEKRRKIVCYLSVMSVATSLC